MRYFKYSRFVSFGVLFLICIIVLPLLVVEHVRAETFEDAVGNAQSHADNPTAPPPGWLATNLVKIPDSGGTFGLQYDTSGNLIVRTATYSSYYTGNYVGQTNYTIHGAPTTDAAFVTTGNDFTRFYDTKGVGLTNTPLINFVEKSVGINNDPKYVHNAIVEFSVNPTNNYIMRPTKNPDIRTVNTNQYGNPDTFQFQQPSDMSDAVFNAFKTYYAATQKTAYVVPSPSNRDFPWTQLGYTYYWGTSAAKLSDIQGCTEFIIPGGTPVNIYGIYSTASYIYTKNKNGAFSNDANAEYGNGFASFNITGDCDTLWAGHSFQHNVSRDASNPNTITIANTAKMSGGEGILVWSLNYTVTNNGTISGLTGTKFGVTGTDNIAVMFEGDTSTLYGTPILMGKNILINSGSVSSAGTPLLPPIAVYVANGDTDITNTGTIASEGTVPGSYAIWLKSGTNTITNSGNIGWIDGSNYSETAIQIDAGTTTVINNGGTITGKLTIADNAAAALNISNKALSITGAYTQNPSSTLKMTANSATDFGTITATSISNASSKMTVTIGGYIPNSTVLSNVINGTGVSVPGTITSTSPIFTFAGNLSSNKVSLTATRANSYNSFASNPNTAASAAALNTLAANNTATGDMRTVLGALDSATSGAEINAGLSALTPQADNSVPQTGYETQNQFINTILSRFDNVVSIQTSGDTGAAILGNDEREIGIWAQGFDTYLHQDPRGLSNGYNANVAGTSIGYDVPVINNFICGLNAGYARDNIGTKDNTARTTADNYEGSIYGSWSHGACYIDAILSFAYNWYDSMRHVAITNIDRTPKATYGGEQYSAYAETGYTFKNNKVTLTPLASAQYMHLHVDSYTEENGGAADLSVAEQNYDMFQTGLGARLSYKLSDKNFTLIPDIHVKWLYDFIGDNQQATSTFTGGGASFATNAFTPAQSSYDIGTRWTLLSKAHITLTLNYDFELKEDFYSHSGYANVRYDF